MSLIDPLVQTDQVGYLTEVLSPPLSLTVTRREVYIAIRNDTAVGSGTAEDPYNGGSATMLDQVLSDPGKITAYMTIHFGPGVFQTNGTGPITQAWFLRSGQRFIGAGVYQTTIQLVVTDQPSGSNNYCAAIASQTLLPPFLQDVEISYMTVDANVSRQPRAADGSPTIMRCDAIAIYNATNVRVRRVRIINWGTHVPLNKGDREGFPLYIAGTSGSSGNFDNIIEDCIVEQSDFSPARENTLINSHAEITNTCFATLRNCYINGDLTTGTPPPAVAIKNIAYNSGTGVMTVTTAWPHRLLENPSDHTHAIDYVVIAGATGASASAYNKRWPVATSDGFCSFTISATGLPSPPTNSGITAQLYVPRAMLVSSVVRTPLSTTVSVGTPLPHGRQTDDWVRISGVRVTRSGHTLFDNYFNGSFKITVTSTTGFTYQADSAPGEDPDTQIGIWLDRWPSQSCMPSSAGSTTPIDVTAEWEFPGTPVPSPNNILIKIKTMTPHYRVPGDYALVGGIVGPPPPAYPLDPDWNGWFPVSELPANSRFLILRAYVGKAAPPPLPANPLRVLVQNGTDNENDIAGAHISWQFQAYSLHGGYGPIGRANRIIGVFRGGPYHDTGDVEDIITWDNYYFSVYAGPNSIANYDPLNPDKSSTEDRTLAERNIVDLQPTISGTWNFAQPGTFGYGINVQAALGYKTIILRKNITRFADGLSGFSAYNGHQEIFVKILGAQNIVCVHNLVDLPGPLYPAQIGWYNSQIYPFDNISPAGAPVYLWNLDTGTYVGDTPSQAFVDELGRQADRPLFSGWNGGASL